MLTSTASPRQSLGKLVPQIEQLKPHSASKFIITQRYENLYANSTSTTKWMVEV